MGLAIYNKLDIPIYVDWKKCAFVVGITKLDYWSETQALASSSVASRFWVGAFNWLDNTYGASVTVLEKPERITFIPPGAAVARGLHRIRSRAVVGVPATIADRHDTVLTTTGVAGGRTFTYTAVRFRPDLTPTSFKSFLTYSTREDFAAESYVSNEFYISRLTEMPLDMFEQGRTRPRAGSPSSNPWYSPTAFYLVTKARLKIRDSIADD